MGPSEGPVTLLPVISNQDLEIAQVDLEDHTRHVGNVMTEEEAFEGMEMMCPATADLGSMFCNL